jgi:pimeloyl-ACP methyl ester carboxylesterase
VLDLTDVTVVANDTGGALTQILMDNHPQRLGRVVLTRRQLALVRLANSPMWTSRGLEG